jgi:hypothetical protein
MVDQAQVTPPEPPSPNGRTELPPRSRTATVARPVWGNNVSLKHVMKSAARTGASCPTLSAGMRPARRRRR